MQRCFSSLGWPEATLDQLLALAVRHGIPAIEVRALGGSIELPPYLAQTYGNPALLAARLREAAWPVRIVAFDAGMKLVGATEAARAELLDLAPWAEALGVPWLRVFDGGKAADAAEIAEGASTLHWWRGERAARGWRVDLMVETHDSLLTAAALGRLLAAVPEAALLWDSHHTWRKGGEDPVVTWRAIRHRVVHIHIKDGTGIPSARHPFSYSLPGDGEFPIAALRAALAADGYQGHLCLEWERKWHPYLPPLEDALRTAAVRAWW
ncbi:MAG: sugar phosphate isomerase/epimerase [Verrucomicrobia bacterium]|nr:sugar phosphate isomerase/epimerase [Verrucomicrobiota bacterium]